MATFRITMKDPDYWFNKDANYEGRRTSAEQQALDTFLEYNEYVTIEFDTVSGTARVVPIRELKD